MPLPSSLLRKLLLAALALIVAMLAALDVYLARASDRRQIADVGDRLTREADLLRREARLLTPDRFQPWARDAAQPARARITVIAADGLVLADSEHDPATMENHAGRPEIVEARAGRRGFSVRHSATLNRDLCYVAMPVNPAAPGLVIRLALPVEDVDAATAAVRRQIVGASVVVAILAIAFAWYFFHRFTSRVRRLQAFAENMLELEAPEGLQADARDELGSLALSLSQASRRLRELLAKVGLEGSRRQAILASMVEGVLAVDNKLRVTFCNESFVAAVGAAQPVPEGFPVQQLVRDPAFLALLARILASGEPARERMTLAAAAGRTYQIQAAPLEDGSTRGAIAILHDISELERLERVRRDFVANVSHEFRTPLAAIQGYTETLLDGGLEDAANSRRFLEIINAQAIRLNNIASDLISLSELESEKASPPLERVSIREAVEAALQTVRPEALIRHVNLSAAGVEDVYIMGHRFRLEQALVNLLQNAVKFNRPEGRVWISASAVQGQVRIDVRDTGIGIPSDDLSRIFERFYRVDKARSRDVAGTGLGLSIVRHIAEKMNGAASVESELGQGSVFSLTFPAI